MILLIRLNGLEEIDFKTILLILLKMWPIILTVVKQSVSLLIHSANLLILMKCCLGQFLISVSDGELSPHD